MRKTLKWLLPLIIWAAIIAAFILHKDSLTVSELLKYTPSNPVLAAVMMLLLFALKSISVVLYSGILYTLNGILFPLPAAIALSILGSAVMVTIPYLIGRKTGAAAADKITAKYPKAAQLRDMRQKNDFFFVFLVRIIGRLPSDVVSLYMGAIHVSYRKYLPACLLGMLPSAIAFSVMGMSVTDVRSPAFLISLCAQIIIMASSVIIYSVYKKKHP